MWPLQSDSACHKDLLRYCATKRGKNYSALRATRALLDLINTAHYTESRMSSNDVPANQMSLPLSLQGSLKADGLRFAIVASRWNDLIVSQLIGGAQEMLLRLGAAIGQLTLVRVPGSFEIPLAASKLANSGRYDAIICVGAVIRGETPHFDYIAAAVTKGIATAAISSGIPIAYGIITADTVEQAINRAGVKAGNKGAEAAMSAVEMANLLKEL